MIASGSCCRAAADLDQWDEVHGIKWVAEHATAGMYGMGLSTS
ncbi:MAG: hypothetical protein WDN04_03085 [Rhodospirillales bacterium]